MGSVCLVVMEDDDWRTHVRKEQGKFNIHSIHRHSKFTIQSKEGKLNNEQHMEVPKISKAKPEH